MSFCLAGPRVHQNSWLSLPSLIYWLCQEEVCQSWSSSLSQSRWNSRSDFGNDLGPGETKHNRVDEKSKRDMDIYESPVTSGLRECGGCCSLCSLSRPCRGCICNSGAAPQRRREDSLAALGGKASDGRDDGDTQRGTRSLNIHTVTVILVE